MPDTLGVKPCRPEKNFDSPRAMEVKSEVVTAFLKTRTPRFSSAVAIIELDTQVESYISSYSSSSESSSRVGGKSWRNASSFTLKTNFGTIFWSSSPWLHNIAIDALRWLHWGLKNFDWVSRFVPARVPLGVYLRHWLRKHNQEIHSFRSPCRVLLWHGGDARWVLACSGQKNFDRRLVVCGTVRSGITISLPSTLHLTLIFEEPQPHKHGRCPAENSQNTQFATFNLGCKNFARREFFPSQPFCTLSPLRRPNHAKMAVAWPKTFKKN